MVFVKHAMSIFGWMSEDELVWLAEQAGKSKRILEVGSHLGRSTSALAINTRGVVYAVDLWRLNHNFVSVYPNLNRLLVGYV